MEAYLHGVSTRKVDDLVTALGADSGISKSEVSRICEDLDADIAVFRDRPLTATTYPYVFLDATYCKARVNRSVVSQAVVVAIGVTGNGRREVLGFDVGDTESQPFWTAFLRSLRARGLGGVKLVISDVHTGLVAAVGATMTGTAWQRCRVHFMRNVLTQVPKQSQEMVASIIRTVFAQPDAEHVDAQLTEVVTMLGRLAPEGRRDARERPRGRHRVPALPDLPLEEDLVHQPARAGEQRDQTTHRRRRSLPEPRSAALPRRRSPGRITRGMGHRRTPLPRRGLHEAPHRRHVNDRHRRAHPGIIRTTR